MLFDAGRLDEALPFAERSWEHRQAEGVPAGKRGRSAFLLAKISWELKQHTRARALAEVARAAFTGASDDAAREVEAWLATR